MNIHAPVTQIPSHVPPDLVRTFPLTLGSLTSSDPYKRMIHDIHRCYPPVFWVPDVYPGGTPAWVVRRFSDLRAIYADDVHFSVKGFAPFAMFIGDSWDLVPAGADAPTHDQYRALLNPLFTPVALKKLETKVAEVAQHLIDGFKNKGAADFREVFAVPFPVSIVLDLLDLPQERMAEFMLWEHMLLHDMNIENIKQATRNVVGLFREVMKERRANPGDDLVSQLASTRLETGDPVPEEVLLSFLRQLMNAAGDTTYRGTSVLMVGLLSNPDQLEAIRADRTLIGQAIEEALRWDGPVTAHLRMAMRDTELGGVRIPKGSLVDLVAGAANRDPDIYENPDKFDIFRKRIPNFAFARGPHICVGQHLARVEMTRALHAILNNLQHLRLDPDKPKPEIRGAIMRVPHHIHVKFDPR